MAEPTDLDRRLLGMRDKSGSFSIGVAVTLPAIRSSLRHMLAVGWIEPVHADTKMAIPCEMFQVTPLGASLIPSSVVNGVWPAGQMPQIKPGGPTRGIKHELFSDKARHIRQKRAESAVSQIG